MLLAFTLFHIVVDLLTDGGRHGGLAEAVENNVGGQGRRVRHVGLIETVIAQLVKDYLVGREVVGGGQLVDSEQEGGLAVSRC